MDNLFLKKHFIFDLDGTLINSNLLHEKAFLETLDGSSTNFKYSDFHGVKTFDVFKALGFPDDKSKALTVIETREIPFLCGKRLGRGL